MKYSGYLEGGNDSGGSISQIVCVGDKSDEITGMPVGCKYILRPVDICNFGLARFFHASLSVTTEWRKINFVGYTSEAQEAIFRCEWTPPALEAVTVNRIAIWTDRAAGVPRINSVG
jgi:hypothetical protein